MKNSEQINVQELNAMELEEIQGGVWWLIPLVIVPIIIKNC